MQLYIILLSETNELIFVEILVFGDKSVVLANLDLKFSLSNNYNIFILSNFTYNYLLFFYKAQRLIKYLVILICLLIFGYF